MKRILLAFVCLLLLVLPAFAIDERTQITIEITFKNELGVLTTPTKVTYRLDDVYSGTQLKGNTDITPTSAVVDITITADANRIINTNKTREEKLLTYKWYAGTTEIGNAQYQYTIDNLAKIPLPSP